MPVFFPRHQTDPRIDLVLSLLRELKQEIRHMGTTLSQQLDNATTAIETSVGVVAAEVTQLLNEVMPGSTITQAQVDRLTAIETALKAIPPATPVVVPPPVP